MLTMKQSTKKSIFGILIIMIAALPALSQFLLEATRKCQFAGSWYEADSGKLSAQLNDYLLQASKELKQEQTPTNSQSTLLAIVAPHAGYAFSGKTAAYSYQEAKSYHPKRIFLMGPSHYSKLRGVALPLSISYETPLGNLDVDKEVVSELKAYPSFSIQPEVHRNEHSLEMQLPFIRQTFGDVKIVPLIVGELSDQSEVRLVAEELKGFVRKDDLIVVSSDFTHYGPRYDYVPFKDNVPANIEKLDKEAFGYLSRLDVQGLLDFEHRTKDTICGFYPCTVLAAMLPQRTKAQLLKYSTSRDSTAEDKDNSVSYLAAAFTGPAWPSEPAARKSAAEVVKLSDTERKILLQIARSTIDLWVKENKTYDPAKAGVPITLNMKQSSGVFVTLYKRSTGKPSGEHQRLREEKQLRGCIGSIWPVSPIYQAVVDNAINACTHDPRFQPVKTEELKDIDIEINVLTPPRRVSSYKDIVLGTDGIILSKYDRQAVFLPSVPTEYRWTLSDTLKQLSLKAGLKDTDWQEGAKYDLFQSVEFGEK